MATEHYKNNEVLLGIEGGHYAPRHMDIVLPNGRSEPVKVKYERQRYRGELERVD
ncbi:hypothetical protein SDJN02_07927, partial [Cucurbita argyrosperma subsp. argyrosperma]